jgi:hypothetical protein
MLRFLLRALGLVALAAAFASAVIDGARSIANNTLAWKPLGMALEQLLPGRVERLQAWAGKIHPKLWDPVLIDVLWVPTSVALAVVGIVLMALASLGRGRRR